MVVNKGILTCLGVCIVFLIITDGTYAIPSLCGTKNALFEGRVQQNTNKKHEQNMTKILR